MLSITGTVPFSVRCKQVWDGSVEATGLAGQTGCLKPALERQPEYRRQQGDGARGRDLAWC